MNNPFVLPYINYFLDENFVWRPMHGPLYYIPKSMCVACFLFFIFFFFSPTAKANSSNDHNHPCNPLISTRYTCIRNLPLYQAHQTP